MPSYSPRCISEKARQEGSEESSNDEWSPLRLTEHSTRQRMCAILFWSAFTGSSLPSRNDGQLAIRLSWVELSWDSRPSPGRRNGARGPPMIETAGRPCMYMQHAGIVWICRFVGNTEDVYAYIGWNGLSSFDHNSPNSPSKASHTETGHCYRPYG